jgi:hypothetical protein
MQSIAAIWLWINLQSQILWQIDLQAKVLHKGSGQDTNFLDFGMFSINKRVQTLRIDHHFL